MLELLKNLFGFGPKIDFKTLLADGATVVDVRTPAEFKDGHIKGAINLPLQTLSSNLNKLKKDQVIITCCRSGSRSGPFVYRLGHLVFNQVRGVRLPYGLPLSPKARRTSWISSG